MKEAVKNRTFKGQTGFSLPELIVVLLIVAILVVLALPQVISSRRALRFSGLQRQVATSLREARQEAMTQKKPITISYEDAEKKIVTHGGKFGAFGDPNNLSVELAGSGLEQDTLIYGRPPGASGSALADTANITPLAGNSAVITFHPDGSVLDAVDLPQNNALFFYNSIYPDDMAFAVSVLGAGGRVKVWRYNKGSNLYVE